MIEQEELIDFYQSPPAKIAIAVLKTILRAKEERFVKTDPTDDKSFMSEAHRLHGMRQLTYEFEQTILNRGRKLNVRSRNDEDDGN